MSSNIDALELKHAYDLIKGLSIPTPPDLLLELNAELSKLHPDDVKVIKLIKKDIGLAAKVLQVINSPAFNLRAEISSIEHAVRMMGLIRLKDTIVRIALRRALDENMPNFEYLSDFSHMVGVITANFARHIENMDPSAAYTVGLFHEVGTLFLMQRFPEYLELHEAHRIEPRTLNALEHERYGTTHAAIGFMMAKHWKLPENVAFAIYRHHIPPSEAQLSTAQADLCSALKLSSYLAFSRYMGRKTEQSEECMACRDQAMKALMIDEESIQAYALECDEELNAS